MKLNCDLGESFGSWRMGLDEAVMPHIDMANIACGFHASDPLTMRQTLDLAAEHGVEIGAHPGYPDLVGFGRRSLSCSSEELSALLHYQIAALSGMAKAQGLMVSYVKPHGAMYNDMMRDQSLLETIICALAELSSDLRLVMQATAKNAHYQELADKYGVTLLFEAFADRAYDKNGLLLPRSQPGAVLHDPEQIKAQVVQLAEEGTVTTQDGSVIKLQPETLCVHGDNPEAVAQVEQISNLLSNYRSA